jgi:hypothetical protein
MYNVHVLHTFKKKIMIIDSYAVEREVKRWNLDPKRP